MKTLSKCGLSVALLLLGIAPAFAPPTGRAVPDAFDGKPEFDLGKPGRGLPRDPRLIDRLNLTPERKAWFDFYLELAKDHPDPNEISRLAAISKLIGPGDLIDALAKAAHQAQGEHKDVPLGPETPNLLVRRPANPDFDQSVEILTNHVKDILQRPVDRDSVELLPFTFSSDAAAKLEREIPLASRARGPWMDRLISGQFEEIDLRMFASLRGKTVVAVGHAVEFEGASAFEIRRPDGQRRYIPLAKMLEASKQIGFNFIPLGCETAESMALGTATKINDLDAIAGFANAMKISGTTSFGKLLSDLSSPALNLTIDLGRLTDGSSVPIDLVDENGRAYGPYSAGPGFSGPQPSTSFAQINPASAGSGFAAVSPGALEASLWLNRWSLLIERIWSAVYKWLAIVALLVAVAEIPFRPALSRQQRITALLAFVLVGGGLALGAGYVLTGWLTGRPDWLLPLFVSAATWGYVLKLAEDFPDHRIAILVARIVVVWIQVPWVAKLLIAGLQFAGLLANPTFVS